jgi:hypothetical protein
VVITLESNKLWCIKLKRNVLCFLFWQWDFRFQWSWPLNLRWKVPLHPNAQFAYLWKFSSLNLQNWSTRFGVKKTRLLSLGVMWFYGLSWNTNFLLWSMLSYEFLHVIIFYQFVTKTIHSKDTQQYVILNGISHYIYDIDIPKVRSITFCIVVLVTYGYNILTHNAICTVTFLEFYILQIYL